MPFSKNVLKSLSTGVVANLLSTVPALGVVVAGSTLVKFVPGFGSITGGVIAAAAYYAAIISAAVIYINALTILYGKKLALTDESLRLAAAEAGRDKAAYQANFYGSKIAIQDKRTSEQAKHAA